MERMILARHGESEYSLHGLLNGDPAVGVGLTGQGEEQARRLGIELAAEPLDLAVHSGFPRTRATLELALAGREVPVLQEPRLADPRAGSFEGGTLDEYRAWAWNESSRVEAPGGGESRLAIVQRYAATYRSRVELTTSAGRWGGGGVLSHPVDSSQSRTGCLSNDGGAEPGFQPATGQNLDESGVRISSQIASSPSIQPSSNLVSAMMIPRSAAHSAPRR